MDENGKTLGEMRLAQIERFNRAADGIIEIHQWGETLEEGCGPVSEQSRTVWFEIDAEPGKTEADLKEAADELKAIVENPLTISYLGVLSRGRARMRAHRLEQVIGKIA